MTFFLFPSPRAAKKGRDVGMYIKLMTIFEQLNIKEPLYRSRYLIIIRERYKLISNLWCMNAWGLGFERAIEEHRNISIRGVVWRGKMTKMTNWWGPRVKELRLDLVGWVVGWDVEWFGMDSGGLMTVTGQRRLHFKEKRLLFKSLYYWWLPDSIFGLEYLRPDINLHPPIS